MRISICSRKSAEILLQKGFPKDTAVVSFHDPDMRCVDYGSAAARVLYIPLDDLQSELPEADRLAEFICTARKDKLNIICQCELGQSRSAGCAAAILEYFSHAGHSVLDNDRYHLDEMVYYSVLDALERRMK